MGGDGVCPRGPAHSAPESDTISVTQRVHSCSWCFFFKETMKQRSGLTSSMDMTVFSSGPDGWTPDLLPWFHLMEISSSTTQPFKT